MVKEFKTSEFGKWKGNLEPEKNAPVCTTSAFISLTDLNNFLQKIISFGADSICVHLLRYDMNSTDPYEKKKIIDGKIPIGCAWLPASNGKSQVAIAISGTKNFDVDDDTYVTHADEIISNDMIWLLMPGGEVDGPGGHNPPTKPKPTGG